jgi:hypothetical protein
MSMDIVIKQQSRNRKMVLDDSIPLVRLRQARESTTIHGANVVSVTSFDPPRPRLPNHQERLEEKSE